MKKLILFLITTVCLFNISYAESKKVALTHMPSKYRTKLSEIVSDGLKAKGYEVITYSYDNIAEIEVADFDAVAIIAMAQWNKADPDLRKFSKDLSAEEKSKLAVFLTAGSDSKDIKIPGIDAISSASKKNNLNSRAKQLLEEIISRING